MSNTPNLDLMLTPEDDTTTTFKAWRVGMNGEDSGSNMMKIDKAYEELNKKTKSIQTKIDTVSDKVFGKTITTWEDVQEIVRHGAAPQYFDIGDQFVVERLLSVEANKGTSTGITGVTVNSDSFIAAFGEVHAGEYTFSYDGKAWRKENGSIVKVSEYGITLTGTPVAGDYVVIKETTTPLTFDVIGIDHDAPADPSYTHSMTMQLHNVFKFESDQYGGGSMLVYDSPEALWYIDEDTYPTGLAAGTYYFVIPDSVETWGFGYTFKFTLNTNVPVGGRLEFTWAEWKPPTTGSIRTYASKTSSDIIESVGVSKGESGTAMPVMSRYDVSTNTNAVSRIINGSCSWLESGIRQWLNTDGAANTWWHPQTNFDMPSADLACKDGFLKGLDPAFLNVVGTVTKQTQSDPVDNHQLITTQEKFFLLSRSEVYAGRDLEADGTAYEYYKIGVPEIDESDPISSLDSNVNRIKYMPAQPGALEAAWMLRTSDNRSEDGIYFVDQDGAVVSGQPYGTYGACPACVIV